MPPPVSATASGPGSGSDLLVDARLGVITSLTAYPAGPYAPTTWSGYSARVADTTEFAGWAADRYGFGASLVDPDAARGAALGEAVERYCGNAVPTTLTVQSWNQLSDRGVRAVDPDRLALYSPAQYASAGFPFVPFTRDLPVAWVPGTALRGVGLDTGEEVLVPASLAYLNYFVGAHADEAPTHALMYSGIATGRSRNEAVRSAIEELAERDALTTWWVGGRQARAVVGAEDLLEDLGIPEACDRRDGTLLVRLLHVPGDLGPPVIVAFVEHPDAGLVSFGSACRSTPERAVAKAVTEALAMLELTREVATDASALWQAVQRGDIDPRTFKPFRADRRYAQDFRPDLHDVVDLPTLAQYYLDPVHQGFALDRLRIRSPSVRLHDIPPADPDSYVSTLVEAGFEPVVVDLTTSDVARSGLHVVRVVIPGLYGNAPPAFPLLGGARVPAARPAPHPLPQI